MCSSMSAPKAPPREVMQLSKMDLGEFDTRSGEGPGHIRFLHMPKKGDPSTAINAVKTLGALVA